MTDTIELMRHHVLNIAIRGELVEQRIEEGTSEEFYQAIQLEKKQLNNKILSSRNDKNEMPFDIPTTWKWIKISNICRLITKGTTPKGGRNAYIDDGIVFLRAENIDETIQMKDTKYIKDETHTKELKRSILKENDLLITIAGTLGRSAVVRKKHLPANINQAISIVRVLNANLVDVEYLRYYFNSKVTMDNLLSKTKATAIPNLTLEIISDTLISLPPLAEQKRIVAKIEEIFAVIDQIGTRKKEALTIINNMRQTALQEAIMGTLLDQDDSDESASILYRKMQAEKEQMMKEKKIKKEKSLPEIESEEVAFDIPKSWKWVKMGALAKKVHYGYTASATEDGNAKMLRITDIQGGRVDWDSVPYCEIEENKIEQYKLNDNDIVIARTGGTVGKSFKINKDSTTDSVFASYLIRIVLTESDSSNYIAYFLNSPYYWEQIGINAQGTGQPNVNATQLSNLILPLPPLAEQHRIVEKLDEIMAICDQMEANFDGSSEVNEDLKVV